MTFEEDLNKELGLCYATEGEANWARYTLEQHKRRVREVLERLIKPTFDGKEIPTACYNQTLKELGL